MHSIKFHRADIPDHAIHLDLHGFLQVVMNALDLAGLERQDGNLGTGFPECLPGSVNSDSSKPLVASTATRKSVNWDMIVLLFIFFLCI
jgi:hypothetical protein